MSFVLISTLAEIGDLVIYREDYVFGEGPVAAAVMLGFIWPMISFSIRRFHDRRMSGWWLLWFTILSLVPVLLIMFSSYEALESGTLVLGLGWLIFVQAVQFFILLALPGLAIPGTLDGVNEYGPDPLENT